VGYDLQSVFERSPTLLGHLGPRVTADDSPEEIVEKARVIIAGLSEKDQIAILDAHPRIGAPLSTLSEPSRREQGAEAEASVLRELMTLQAQYERAFGFRFVVFVAGRSKEQLLPVLRERMTRSRQAELRAGTDAFLAISLDRLRRQHEAEMREVLDDGW
jgi:2-oxo-4-hydroxy-4-carboxy--5-ureidoimidazoline (OHCU) decarboxylase